MIIFFCNVSGGDPDNCNCLATSWAESALVYSYGRHFNCKNLFLRIGKFRIFTLCVWRSLQTTMHKKIEQAVLWHKIWNWKNESVTPCTCWSNIMMLNDYGKNKCICGRRPSMSAARALQINITLRFHERMTETCEGW